MKGKGLSIDIFKSPKPQKGQFPYIIIVDNLVDYPGNY